MKLKFKTKNLKHINEYEVRIHFYHGDMDSTDERSFYFKTEKETINLIKELQKLNKKHFHYRPEHRIEIEEYIWKVETSSNLINKLFHDWDDEDWPWHNDFDSYAALDYWEVYFWDDLGRRIDIEVSK